MGSAGSAQQPDTNPRPKKLVKSDGAVDAIDDREADSIAPWRDHFDAEDWGGAGDCFCCSSAAGLAKAAGKAPPKSGDKHFAPGGKMQSQLRVLAACEIRKHPDQNRDFADKIAI